MGYKSTHVYTYVLQTSSHKKIAKLLSRGASLASISMECFHDEAARHIIIKRTVGHYIKKELAAMCSDKTLFYYRAALMIYQVSHGKN